MTADDQVHGSPDQESEQGPDRELEEARRTIRELEEQIALVENDRKAAAAALSFRTGVIEQAAEGVCVCQNVPEFPFVRFSVWNRRMVEITGYEIDEINQLGWYQAMYPDPVARETARVRMDRMRDGDNLDFERWEIQPRNGTKCPVAISTSVLVANDGAVHVLALMHDLSVSERLREERWRSRTDELTGTRNLRGFNHDAEMLLDLARNRLQPATIAFLDLSEFKKLNDTRGHREGDRALKAIGSELLSSFRSLDVIGRIGGDEFAIVITGRNDAGARQRFDSLLQRLSDLAERSGWDFGFALGVVNYPRQIPSLSEALEHADRLMYRAKESGGKAAEYEVSPTSSDPTTSGPNTG